MKNNSEDARTEYGFYSKLLQRPFDDLKELMAAEDEYKKEQSKKEELSQEKKRRAKEVEDAYLEYMKTKEEAYTKIAEAEKKWIERRDKFAQDYNGYHMTYVDNNGQKTITFGDLINNFFERFGL